MENECQNFEKIIWENENKKSSVQIYLQTITVSVLQCDIDLTANICSKPESKLTKYYIWYPLRIVLYNNKRLGVWLHLTIVYI